jgi:hypothetical protein
VGLCGVSQLAAPHRPRRFRSLPWSSLAETLDDHDEVAGREVGFSPARCDPGLDVLGAIIDNHAHLRQPIARALGRPLHLGRARRPGGI